MGSPKVVVVDHHDSYTWNLVHLVAAVTGVLPVVVQHDETTPTSSRSSTSCCRRAPAIRRTRADFSVGRVLLVPADRRCWASAWACRAW